ncbi:MAG: metallophosphoesterase family protein [Thermoplasmata archaeon]|nr:MAG: metallophosphoesterase family protein [Thermoplasmata archaeon]
MSMRILLLSDYHGATDMLRMLPRIIKDNSPDLIVFCGDIVKGYARGNEWLAARADMREPDRNLPEIRDEAKEDLQLYQDFYSILGAMGILTFVIPGNMDAPKSRYSNTLEAAQNKYGNIFSIHNCHEKFDDVTFVGFGGEITQEESEDFFVAMYNRDEVIQGLYKSPRTIYVTHTPPLCSKVDLDKTVHKGNIVVNAVLERMQPMANFCGHAHNGRGSEKIDNTTIINPGAFKAGNFAIVELDVKTKNINVKFKNCLLMKK